jgi:hypothetical protein
MFKGGMYSKIAETYASTATRIRAIKTLIIPRIINRISNIVDPALSQRFDIHYPFPGNQAIRRRLIDSKNSSFNKARIVMFLRTAPPFLVGSYSTVGESTRECGQGLAQRQTNGKILKWPQFYRHP